MINNFFDYKNSEGHRVRVPKGFSGNLRNTKQALLASSADISVPSAFLPGVAEDMRKKDYLSSLSVLGYLQTNPDNGGVTLVQQDGSPVVLSDGSLLSMSFDEIERQGTEDVKSDLISLDRTVSALLGN